MKSTSHPSSIRLLRAASRSLRFTRLRVTAFPTPLPTEKPNRLTHSPFGLVTNTNSRSKRPLRRRSAAKSSGLVRRLSLRTRRDDFRRLWSVRP